MARLTVLFVAAIAIVVESKLGINDDGVMHEESPISSYPKILGKVMAALSSSPKGKSLKPTVVLLALETKIVDKTLRKVYDVWFADPEGDIFIIVLAETGKLLQIEQGPEKVFASNFERSGPDFKDYNRIKSLVVAKKYAEAQKAAYKWFEATLSYAVKHDKH